jgi:hypothetical protein
MMLLRCASIKIFIASFTVRIIVQATYIKNTLQLPINKSKIEHMIHLIQLINPNKTGLVYKSCFFDRFTTFSQNVLGEVSYRNKILTTLQRRDIRAVRQHTRYMISTYNKKRKYEQSKCFSECSNAH